MSVLKLYKNYQECLISFQPPMALTALLQQHGVEINLVCGGRGTCGKCRVLAEGQLSERTAFEPPEGPGLACRVTLLGDAAVTLLQDWQGMRVEGAQGTVAHVNGEEHEIGIAVDIGSTTVCMAAYDLRTGDWIARKGMRNPQGAVAADVIGRIDAALHGKGELLQRQIRDAIDYLIDAAAEEAGFTHDKIERLVFTGNTTMLYLLCGRNPECLSHAPFDADCLFDKELAYNGRPCYLPPCMEAFVGADTVCAILSSNMMKSEKTAILCDIGTNGEMALWRKGKLFVASTAAGPVFEGAGISCGVGSVDGAIDEVAVKDGKLLWHTIGDAKPVGICGSGLVSLIAALLDIGVIDETGYMEEECYALCEGVSLTRADIRAFQLGKAAIAAGMMTLLKLEGISPKELSCLMIAGGFGSHLNLTAAKRVGLIPREIDCEIELLGNAALEGAAILLRGGEESRKTACGIQQISKAVVLSGNAVFGEEYMERMMFEE